MAITLFTRAVLEGRAITVFGDGSMRRDFTHVSDIVRGIFAALEGCPPGFRAYNLGSSAPVDLKELVGAIGVATGRVLDRERGMCRSGMWRRRTPTGGGRGRSRGSRRLGWRRLGAGGEGRAHGERFASS